MTAFRGAPPFIKICGLTDKEAVRAATGAGADMISFVFYPQSPRAVTPARAAALAAGLSDGAVKVAAVFVDPTDAELDAVLRHIRPDALQLHGSESPQRVERLRLIYGVEAIKAIGVAGEPDLKAAEPYLGIADRLLFDARAPRGAGRPGGNAQAFPWGVMRAWSDATTPWLLAGGLTAANVAEAIAQSGAPGVDVSSGVESEPGEKDPSKITAFIKSVRP